MEVTIQAGSRRATDLSGREWEIEGIEITRQNTGQKVFYGLGSSYYKAVAASGTKSQAFVLPTGKIILI